MKDPQNPGNFKAILSTFLIYFFNSEKWLDVIHYLLRNCLKVALFFLFVIFNKKQK